MSWGFLAAVGPRLTAYVPNVEAGGLVPSVATTLPANVQYAWQHPRQPILYVASSDGVGGRTHRLTALRLPALEVLGDQTILPARPIHICVDGAGRRVLVAFNNPPGLRVWRIEQDAKLGAEQEQGELDVGIFPHQVRLSADDALAIVVARGNDATSDRPEDPGALKLFRYDDGRLSPLATVAPDGGFGFGPRHLDFHPTEPWVFVSLERQNSLTMFARAGLGLEPAARFSRSSLSEPDHMWPRQLGGTVRVHPTGRFVYMANRADDADADGAFVGGDNTMAVFAIDPANGKPTLVQHAETHGFHCRTFSIDPTGRLLIAAHIAPMRVRDGGTVQDVSAGMSSFRIEADGRLTFLCRTPVETHGQTLFWSGIVRLDG